MVATSVRQPKTYEDYLNTPNDGQRHELIDGEIVVSAAPAIDHQRLVGRLFRMLSAVAESTPGDEAFISPIAVSLDLANTLEPDLVYRARDSASVVEKRRIRGAPELVIEVLSPGTSSRDQIQKRANYERARVQEFWIVDPARKRVTALRLREGRFQELQPVGTRLASEIAPLFVVDLAELFKNLD